MLEPDQMNLLEDDEGLQSAYRPGWYGYYSWPAWWSHFNGVGRVTWTAKLAPGQSAEQSYEWHYFWR